jgi:hypothetical protein
LYSADCIGVNNSLVGACEGILPLNATLLGGGDRWTLPIHALGTLGLTLCSSSMTLNCGTAWLSSLVAAHLHRNRRREELYLSYDEGFFVIELVILCPIVKEGRQEG